ncbi:tetratricopeptide repeat protein [Flavobacterium sp. UBA6135]|uniref:tetratricopeptide repeat protein n=1 Tax=Flavobacterium sp. UBA6135 TaxID=1946553 RepID=UPI0025C3798C|nr:tetratricopeptide repeat protein [Flavobacterium sp. UBA6135]
MKTKLTFLIVILFGFYSSIAQPSDCADRLSIFVELAKSKNYTEAYEHLNYLRKSCPSQNAAIYLLGEPTLNYYIDNAKSTADKEKHVRDLMKLFEEYDQYFPGNGKGNSVKRGLALFDNNIGTPNEVFQILDKSFKNDKANFTNPKALLLYFQIFVDDYEAGNKGIQLQEVFDMYDVISDKLEEEAKVLSDAKDLLIEKQESGEALTTKEQKDYNRYEVNLEAFETVGTSMDAKIELLATCDRLVPFFSKGFDEKKGDAEWLRRAAQRLDRKGCSSDPFFAKISDALHLLNPTAESAYNLGVSFYNKKNTAKALEYFNQAAELHTDKNKKANVYYTIATNIYGNGNKTQARAYAEKALAARPSMGRAYLFIAQLYANSVNDCGVTPFEKRAVNWLAAQTARKAGQVDSSLKATADQTAASYEQRAPSRQDIFQENMAGQTISFKCWIGKSVTVPSL